MQYGFLVSLATEVLLRVIRCLDVQDYTRTEEISPEKTQEDSLRTISAADRNYKIIISNIDQVMITRSFHTI